jgi:hypothetical protein
MVQDDGAKLEGRGNGIVAVKTIQPCGQMVAGNRSWLPHVLGSAISKAASVVPVWYLVLGQPCRFSLRNWPIFLESAQLASISMSAF